MKHLIAKKKLNRTTSHRVALEKALATALLKNGKIETTTPKAKFVRPFVEKLITIAKLGTGYTTQKLLQARLGTDAAVRDLFKVAELNKTRNGGYTRIIKTGYRAGDQGQTARIEIVDFTKPQAKAAVKAKKVAAPKTKKKSETSETK